MPITRRTFLHSALAASFTAAIVSNPATVFGQRAGGDIPVPLPPETYSHPLFSMTSQQFESAIGETFSVTSADGSVRQLILAEVSKREIPGNTLRNYYGESFSLVFESRGRISAGLAQDIYEISGNVLAPSLVLMVPIDRAQRRYEVVLNHLTR